MQDLGTGGRAPFDQLTKLRVQLRCAAGDVEYRDLCAFKKCNARIGDTGRHDLGTIGARIDVTVPAGLVAPLAEVDLQHVDGGGVQRRERRRCKRVVERSREWHFGEAT